MNGRRLFRVSACICTLLLAAALFRQPAAADEPDLDEYDIPIKKSRSKIQKLQSGIEIHLGKLQIAGEREFSLLGQIEDLDRDLALQRVRLEVLQERLDSQQQLLAVKQRELAEAKTSHRQVKEHLKTRLRSYYLMGKTGILNVTFSTRTLPELMLFNDSFRTLLSYDQDLIVQYRESIGQLTQATEAHAEESRLLGEFILAAVEQQKELDILLGEKKKLLHRVKSEKVLYEQALKEMKKAETELQETLVDLQKKKTYIREGFVANKGSLPPPVSGTLVRRFGEKGDSGREAASGIIIDARDGEPIKSVFAGKIIFAGYKRGYGNMVIIDHGLDYYSITARMGKISVEAGQRVNGGDIIGTAGDIATLFEEGISFEIRHETTPVNPLEWVRSDGLRVKSESG